MKPQRASWRAISYVAIAQALATFIDELCPRMGMCTVTSEASSNAWQTPVFSAPTTRQIRSPGAMAQSCSAMLRVLSSRLTMRQPCAFSVATVSSGSAA